MRMIFRGGNGGQGLLAWLLLGLPMLGLMISESATAAREVSSSRECAVCHVMWLTDFKRRDLSPLIPYDPKPKVASGVQDVSSTEEMCFSCHDGFMLDSRPMWKENRHAHPVGIEPTDKVRIPTKDGKTIFPMNDDGKIYCGTCHTAHGVSWDQTESPVFMRLANVDSSLCIACHVGPATGAKEGNHPVFDELEWIPPGLKKSGFRMGKGNVVICQSCHTPHGAEGKPLLVRDNQQAGLCGSCHSDKALVVGSKHDLTVMAPKEQNEKGLTAGKSGPCSACHMVHGGQVGTMLWARKNAAGVDPVSSQCMSCHNEDGIAQDKTIQAHSHPLNVAISDVDIAVQDGDWSSPHPGVQLGSPLQALPLFDANGQPTDKAGNISCLTCHDPHVWSVNHSENISKPDPHQLEGDGQNSFLRIAQGDDSALCANCHVDKRAVKISKHNLTLYESDLQQRHQITLSPQRELDQGLCGTCHRVHNSEGANLRAWPVTQEKGGVGSLCTSCHQSDGIAAEKLTGNHSHPVQVALQNLGGETSLPLFDDQGKRDVDHGKVDCATCHDPHLWDAGNPLSRSGTDLELDGDAGNSFLRLPAAPASELCVDCHHNQALVVGTDHDMRVTGATAQNFKKQGVTQTGVCGQCHSVHNAVLNNNLWARIPGQGLDREETLCNSCHAQESIGGKKIPNKPHHPDDVLVWSNEARSGPGHVSELPNIPVFSQTGERSVLGKISCASCHNPHQWDPRKQQQGSNRNLEGDAMSSFLRNASSAAIVCADCHGEDAIFRYKYFHGETSRRKHGLYR